MVKRLKSRTVRIKKGSGFKKVAGISLLTLAALGAAPLIGDKPLEAVLGGLTLATPGIALIASDAKKKKGGRLKRKRKKRKK